MKLFEYLKVYRLELISFFVGGAILALELTAARVAAPYIGATMYTWTSIIGVILASLAVGYWAGGYLADKRKRTDDLVLLLTIASISVLIVNFFKDWLLSEISQLDIGLQWQSLIASLALFSIPTIALGAISPYLIRLSINKASVSGRAAGRINGAGTIGSLAGTFLTGYVLFGYVGSRNILSWLALMIVLLSFALGWRTYLWLRMAVLAFCLAGIIWPSSLHISGLVKDLDTKYSRVMIIDRTLGGQPVRALQTDNLALQSAIYLNGNKELAVPYIRGFSYAAALRQDASKYLVIGGGAFTFPQYLADTNPQATVDVVEVDDKLPSIGGEFFGFKKPPNLNIFTADGRQYLNQNSNTYSMIFVDAFSGITPPFQLFTIEAAEQMKQALDERGVVVANVISNADGSGLIEPISNTFRRIFSYVEIYPVGTPADPNKRRNFLLLASREPFNHRTMPSDSTPAETRMIFNRSLSLLGTSETVLTDNLAPVERLSQLNQP